MVRVVASCTTLPDRYDNLKIMLKSLKKQTHPLDEIYLTIPKRAHRLNKLYPSLPTEIKQICTPVYIDVDYGPITKIYGALAHETDSDTIIITVDDDNIYPPDL